MSAFAERRLAFAIVGLAAVLSGPAFAQSDSAPPTPASEPPDEITVRGQKSLGQYRVELEQARNEIFAMFNEVNAGNDTDITCRDEQPTGSRMAQNVCRSNAEEQGNAAAARNFLSSLLFSSGQFRSTTAAGGSQVNANIGTGSAQGAGTSGTADALTEYEGEWKRVLGENPELFQAVVNYIDLENQYDQARGLTVAPTDVTREAPAQANAPQCEATTLTEYFQRNNVARVTGKIDVSNCPAGTTGNFTLVARVRGESGEINPIEFAETWQRDDAEQVAFNGDYPIGDNVELVNVRVRGLTCTCADPAPTAQ